MKMMKRGFALLLSAVLVVGMLPVRAEAVNGFVNDFTFRITDLAVNGQIVDTDPNVYSWYFNHVEVKDKKQPGVYSFSYRCKIEKTDDQNVFVNLLGTNDPMEGTFTWESCANNLEIEQTHSRGNKSWKVTIIKNALSDHETETVTTKEATCSDAGEKKTVCKNCATVIKTESVSVDANAHKYTWTNDRTNHFAVCEYDSTHTISGSCEGGTATCKAKAVCTICNLPYGSLVDHIWSEWTYDSAAVVNLGHYRTCSVCNPEALQYTYTGFEFAGHDYKDATCIKQGECECGSKSGSIGDHSMTYEKDGNTIKQVCANSSEHNAIISLEEDTTVSTVYTGSEIKALKAQFDGYEVPVEIQYSDNTDVGTAKGTLTLGGHTIEKSFEITVAEMKPENVQVSDYEGTYDGQPHGISVTGSEGSTVKYGTSEEDCTLNESPTLTNAGSLTVYYKVTNPNYENAVTGSATVTISRKEVTVKAEDMTVEYGDTAPGLSDFGYKFDGIVAGEAPVTVLGGGPILSCDDYEQNDPAGETFEITVNTDDMKPNDNYTVKAENGTLTIVPRELEIQWKQGEDENAEKLEYTYDEKSHVPTATVTNAVGEDEITLTVSGAETNANIGDETYTATVSGFTVKGSDKNNYKLPDVKPSTTFKINPKQLEKPTGLSSEPDPILNKGEGKITGVTTAMEYLLEGSEEGFVRIKTSDIKDNAISVASGTYLVRNAINQGDINHLPSETEKIVVGATKTLTVTVPENPAGYTLEAEKNVYGYDDDPKLFLTVTAGYNLIEDEFEVTVKIGDTETKFLKDDLAYDSAKNEYTFTIPDLRDDATVTEVKGIADVTKPQLRVTVSVDPDPDENDDDEVFTSLMESGVTFTDYKGMHTLITVADTTGAGSELTILYLESDQALTKAQLDDTEDEAWDTYAAGGIEPNGDGNKIFYFKAVDKAGNESEYVSTDGFIYDGTAPSLSLGTGVKTFGITRRVTIEDANLLSINIDGTDQKIEDSEGNDRTKITYRITRNTSTDKAKTYEFVVKDKAGNVSEATYTVEPLVFDEKAVTKSWSQGSTKTADFKVNAVLGDYDDVDDYDMKFQVKIDSKVIDEKNYTIEPAEDGSGTVIKLKTTYLKTLKAAKHKIQVSVIAKKTSTTTETLDSTEVYEFTVSNNPKTGDTMNLPFWGGMTMVSLLCGAAMILSLRKKEWV